MTGVGEHQTGDDREQCGLARSARAHHGNHLASPGGDRGVEMEPVAIELDVDIEPGRGGAASCSRGGIAAHHCTRPGRHARTSSRTVTAVTSSRSDKATAVPCETPAPLNAV